MPSKLFVLLKSPSEYAELDLLAALGGDDRIGALLFEDAVLYSVLKDKGEELLSIVDHAYVMGDDLEARGFKGKASKGFEVIDYPRAIDLIMDDYDLCMTI